MEGYLHTPVLVSELLEFLSPRSEGIYVDANLGGGGHAQAVLERLDGSGLVIGIDLDPMALRAARERLARFPNFRAVHGNFADLDTLLDAQDIDRIDGIWFDLGVSSPQLDLPARGFSIKAAGPLDMRFNAEQNQTADDLVNGADLEELTRIIRDYGEERWAAPIARRIVQKRPIHDTATLANVVAAAIPRKFHPPRIHPATRTFQALRIAVNDELESLQQGLDRAVARLRTGGRLCCIAWHSLEDRIVKQAFNRHAGQVDTAGLPRGFPVERPTPTLRVLTRQPVTPSEAEVAANPRARSARMRAAEKIHDGMDSGFHHKATKTPGIFRHPCT